MARLLKKPYPVPEWDSTLSVQENLASEDEVLEKIECITFPIADGHAVYRVVSIHPPVLQHVPVGDAWTVHPALIHGLRAEDIEAKLERKRRLKELFETGGRNAQLVQ